MSKNLSMCTLINKKQRNRLPVLFHVFMHSVRYKLDDLICSLVSVNEMIQ